MIIHTQLRLVLIYKFISQYSSKKLVTKLVRDRDSYVKKGGIARLRSKYRRDLRTPIVDHQILVAMSIKLICQSLEFEAVLEKKICHKNIHNKLRLLPIAFVLPPSFALYASPTPQFELLNTAAITPALFSPCLSD